MLAVSSTGHNAVATGCHGWKEVSIRAVKVTTVTDLADPVLTLAEATTRVAADLHGVGRLGVAFSGGVDSTVLLALAARALGRDQVIALLGVSPSLAAAEQRAAHRVGR